MDQDQIRDIVNRAISSRDPWLFLSFVLAVIVSVAASFVLPYLKRKGEDRATTESLSKVTRAVESIKSTYGKEIETLKAFLGTKSHFSRLRYEREMEVYKELWTALVELGVVTQLLRPVLEMADPTETEDQRKEKKTKAFMEKHNRHHEITTKNRPFYPSEVWQKLHALLKLTQVEFLEYHLIDPKGGTPATAIEYLEKAGRNQAEITEKINDICEAIRHRLDKFDGPDSLA